MTFVLVLLAATALFSWALRDVPFEEIAQGVIAPRAEVQQPGTARYEDFPQHLIDAVISAEDRRFFDHHGVDLRGIVRAFARNLDAGEVVQGGSTITQQLIKISYLDRERTYRRKLQELVIAVWLENRLDKREILTRYLNAIYLGAGATGVSAAAQTYFGKRPAELDLAEAAMIVGLIPAPSVLNPRADPTAARQRAAFVLDAMVDNGRITREAAEAAKAELPRLAG